LPKELNIFNAYLNIDFNPNRVSYMFYYTTGETANLPSDNKESKEELFDEIHKGDGFIRANLIDALYCMLLWVKKKNYE